METPNTNAAEAPQESKMATALAVVTAAVAEFDKVAEGLAELKHLYGGVVYEVTTTKGMTDAKAARMAIRQPRYDLEKLRKKAKAPILNLGRDLDAEAARITAEIEAIENPIHEQITNEETRKENERQALIDAERNRVTGIRNQIAAIRNVADGASLRSSAEVKGLLDVLSAVVIDDSFAEFIEEAKTAHAVAMDSLRTIHVSRVEFETQQALVEQQRIELEQRQAEQAERERIERERIAEEDRLAKIARDEEVARQTEALRLQREEQARSDDEARLRRETEQREHEERMREQREEAERVARQQREAQALIDAENNRLAEERERLEQLERERIEALEVATRAPEQVAVEQTPTPAPVVTQQIPVSVAEVTVAHGAQLPAAIASPVQSIPGAVEPSLEVWAEEAFDTIDAGFFSGDTFHSEAACQRAEFYIGRWQRQIVEIRQMLTEEQSDAA